MPIKYYYHTLIHHAFKFKTINHHYVQTLTSINIFDQTVQINSTQAIQNMKSNCQEPIQTIQKSLNHLSQILGKQFSFPISEASHCQGASKVTQVYPIVTAVEPFYIEKHHLDDRQMRDALNYVEFQNATFNQKNEVYGHQRQRNQKKVFQDDYGYIQALNINKKRPMQQGLWTRKGLDTKNNHSRKESSESQFQKYINKNSQLRNNRQIQTQSINNNQFSFRDLNLHPKNQQKDKEYYRQRQSSGDTHQINKIIQFEYPDVSSSKKTVFRSKNYNEASTDKHRPYKNNRKSGLIYSNNLKKSYPQKRFTTKCCCCCPLKKQQFSLSKNLRENFHSKYLNSSPVAKKRNPIIYANHDKIRFFNRCLDSDTDSYFSQYDI